MKKIVMILMAILVLGRFCLAESLSAICSGGSYALSLEHMVSIDAVDGYTVQQGAATDGKFAYFILENQDEDLCSLWKVDMETWEVVDKAFGLALDHGNDMTYNPNTGRLVAVHNKPHYSWVSIINPETLEIEQTLVTSTGMRSIAYSAERDQYAVGLAGNVHFALLDSDFRYIAKIKCQDPGLTTQGMDCDENHVYFPLYNRVTGENIVSIYDWEGNFVGDIPMEDNGLEVEAMFNFEGNYYASYYGQGSHTYRLTLNAE